MSKEKEVKSVARRDFFKKVGLGAGAAGVAAAAATTAEASEGVKTPGGTGYKETDHVKKFYQLARF